MLIRTVLNIAEHLDGHEPVAMGIGFDRRLYVLLAQQPSSYRESLPGGSFAVIRPSHPQRYRLLVINHDGEAWPLDLGEHPFNYHHVQPLPDGTLLLASARTRYRGANDFDLNGVIASDTGRILRQILLGDGIQDVQVDKNGLIWTSYFDEGVFGNYGWVQPVGQAGLLAWDATGRKLFEFVPPPGQDAICDCYALNVASSSELWLYYYTEFPLVKLHNKQHAGVWSGIIAGSDAFAVSRDVALFRGGYDDRDNYHLYRLSEGQPATLLATIAFEAEEGATLRNCWAAARGERMFLLHGSHLSCVTVDDCLAASRT